MAEIKAPVIIDGFKCVEDMAQAVLNYTYKGKTLKEWADSISEPQSNADRFRSMSDEEMAEYLSDNCSEHMTIEFCQKHANCYECWLDWLRQEAKE